MRPHSSYPWPGRAQDKNVWVQKVGTLLHIKTDSTVQFVQDLGFVSAMHQHSGVSKADDTLNSGG